eukprot:1490566-Heterocapsa_arctica.AAC.1
MAAMLTTAGAAEGGLPAQRSSGSPGGASAPVGAVPLGVLRVDPGGQRTRRVLDESAKSRRRGSKRRKEVEGDLERLTG